MKSLNAREFEIIRRTSSCSENRFFEEHNCFSLPISILSTTDTAKIFEAKSEFNEFEIHDTSNQRLHIRFCS